MIIIQNERKDIIACSPTLTKAMDQAGIKRIKYEYIRHKVAGHKRETIKYKQYYITRW